MKRGIAGALTTLCTVGALTACATGHVTRLTDDSLHSPKVIALDAPNAPWVIQIQKRLVRKGFIVKRWGSTERITASDGPGRLTEYNEASARYILVLKGAAPMNWGRRCFGGGYKFDYLNADLVDAETNQTLLNVNGSGYSEGCAPLSGSLYGDIATAVAKLWKTTQG